ncbi:MAG: efflux RND transporter periplasmic adaptor subunit [Phycisphaerales bacterium]
MKSAVTGLFLAIACAAGCGRSEPPPPPPPEVTVRTVVVAAEQVERVHSYPGITASVRPVMISARVTGFLDKQHVEDGATVKAGDLLYTIDPRPFEASLAQARAALAQAEAQVPAARAARQLAEREVERNRPLAASGAISKQAFDQLETKFQQADAQYAAANAAVDASRAQVDVAGLNLSYCRITAPMDGMIGDTAAYEGQMVGPGYTVQLNQLVQLDPMFVEFAPSATEWPLLRERMAGGSVPARVVYGGVEGIEASGTVGFASNVVSTSTATIMLRATFPNTDGAFRPGTFCNVHLDLGEIPDVVMVPTSALVARETDFFVWRVKQDDTVENVRVRLSIRQEERAGVVEGLKVGDRVVVAGTQKLREGARIVEQSAGKPAAKEAAR